LGREHYQTGFHQTGTAGCFGAAIAAARLLGCEHAAMTQAIGLASTRAAGLKSQFGTMGKPYNAGAAAAMGVEVALLAKAGFVSNPNGLDGPQGFGPTHAGSADVMAFEGMGTDWLFEQVSHKFHACCHGTHAMIEALQGVDFNAAQVSNIKVRTHPRWLKVCNQPEPATGLEAKFSYRLIAALVLSGYDTASLDTFSDALTQHPSLTALRDKVTVVEDPQLSETSAHVTITAGDDAVVTSADISLPMDLELRLAKLIAKAEALIGKQAMMLKAATLEGPAPDLGSLTAL
jgi:2-methylcitrate dehydratase PrpD